MDKKKEIEEMASVISGICEKQSKKYKCDDCNNCMAEFLIEAGYRKANSVRTEFAYIITHEVLPKLLKGDIDKQLELLVAINRKLNEVNNEQRN